MPKVTFIYWRDIPAQVAVQRGRAREKALLGARFQEAIDRAAMRAGKGSSDAYLAEWRYVSSTRAWDGELRALARQEAERLEAEFPDELLHALVRNHGSRVD